MMCHECGGEHEPDGARSSCIRHWKLRALQAENSLLVIKIYGTPVCGHCGGKGSVDTGGFTPWGEPIELPCPQCTEKWDALTIIGASWRKNSSLEKWFPLTAEEIDTLKRENEELKARLKGTIWKAK